MDGRGLGMAAEQSVGAIGFPIGVFVDRDRLGEPDHHAPGCHPSVLKPSRDAAPTATGCPVDLRKVQVPSHCCCGSSAAGGRFRLVRELPSQGVICGRPASGQGCSACQQNAADRWSHAGERDAKAFRARRLPFGN